MDEKTNPVARLSVLDRLLLDDGWEGVRSAERTNRLVRASIRRDLEILFNSRPRYRSWPAELEELAVSNLSFGLPDIQTLQIADDKGRDLYRRLMVQAIERFEPRLKDVTVEIPASTDALDRTFRFRIHAVLVSDADGEPVVFDTVLDPTSRALSILGAGRAVDVDTL